MDLLSVTGRQSTPNVCLPFVAPQGYEWPMDKKTALDSRPASSNASRPQGYQSTGCEHVEAGMGISRG